MPDPLALCVGMDEDDNWIQGMDEKRFYGALWTKLGFLQIEEKQVNWLESCIYSPGVASWIQHPGQLTISRCCRALHANARYMG
jgi:hypothetical protein